MDADEVLAASLAGGPVACAAGGEELARLEELLSDLPVPADAWTLWRRFGGGSPPLPFQGLHGPQDVRVATAIAFYSERLGRRLARADVRAVLERRAPLVLGFFGGACQDCGPVRLEASGAIVQDDGGEQVRLASSAGAWLVLSSLSAAAGPKPERMLPGRPRDRASFERALEDDGFALAQLSGGHSLWHRADGWVLVPGEAQDALAGESTRIALRGKAALERWVKEYGRA